MRWATKNRNWRGYLWRIAAGLLAAMMQAAPSINAPNVNPSTVTVNQPTSVTASCQINTNPGDPPLIAGGVNVVRMTGTASSVVGTMQDTGNGLYSLQFNDTESTVGTFQLQCTAAFEGMLQRVKSPLATVTVINSSGSGSIGTITLAPASVTYGVAANVTITAPVTGGTPDPGSVMLQRLDSSGRVLAILGTLHDDGLNGDPVANDGNYTLITSFTEFAVGAVPLRVSATFSNTVNHALSPVANLTVTGTPPPTVTITSPSSLSFLNLSPTTVTGTVSDPAAKVVINAINAPVDPTGKFSATVPLTEGPNILTATATSPSGTAGTASITVTLDTTPPHVTITSPTDQFTTAAASVSVAGNVNDIVVGTVNSQQATVTVNGVAGQVANRTFLAQNVPLSMGSNTIQAVAIDHAGNQATTQITVVRQSPQPGQISLVSGNNQAATIGTALPTPLAVSLTDSTGAPAVNKQVLFSVTQNNGMLSVNGGKLAASVLAITDTNGHASVNWTLGMRSGAGSDAVQAYSVGYSGTAMFTASANQGTPGLIVVDTGNNQTGAVNQPLPKQFSAVVIDAGNNRLPNVSVTFTVVNGGGSFAGQPSTTVTTDSDGRAGATLTLGFQEGNSNNIVTATFPGNTGFPASFTASGLGPGNPNATVISGVVLDNANQPIAGATVRALLDATLYSNPSSAQTAVSVQTDATGHFSIYKAPVGYVKLFVDGSTSSTPGPFPILEYDMVTVTGQVNTVNRPIFLVALKTSNQLCVTDTTGGGTLTIPDAPGFSLTFGPGQVTFPGGSKTGCVSVTQVHPDKVPMEPGFGQQPRFIVTIQPAGAVFNPPAPITIPNVDGLKPREVTEMYSYDHDISSFVAVGTGTVSDDGQVIRSNPGIGVLKAGWHCGGNPSVAGAAAECGPCAYCDGQNCQPKPGSAGQACQNPCLVQGTGTCDQAGHCTGQIKYGAPCGNGGTCDRNGNCVFAGGGGGGCGNCNSGFPCIDDSCNSTGQCVSTVNQSCQNACAGKQDGEHCAVGSLTGICRAGNCDLCPSLTKGATCTCGGGIGTCDASGACSCALTVDASFRGLKDPLQIYIRQGNQYSGTSSSDPNVASSIVTTQVSVSGGNYYWLSTDPSVVSVQPNNDTAVLVGLKPGQSTISIAYTVNGQTAGISFLVNVFYPIILVHGIASGADTWTQLINSLAAPLLPTAPTGYGLHYDQQSNCQPSNPAHPAGLDPDLDFCAMDFGTDPLTSGTIIGATSSWMIPDGSQSSFKLEGQALARSIADVLNATGASKVMLVGHSMGGLASREAIQLLGSAASVNRLITVGTPHQGSYLAQLNTDTIQHSGILAAVAANKLDPNSPGVQSLAPGSMELNEINNAPIPHVPEMTHISIVSENTAAAAIATGLVSGIAASCGTADLWCLDFRAHLPALLAAIPVSDLLVTTPSQNLNSVFPYAGAIVDSSLSATHIDINTSNTWGLGFVGETTAGVNLFLKYLFP